ncbi:hypothetical protein CSZ94_04125 [Janthinobacterium sp. ROICE36]|uniref:histidine kinase dimerization/phospho-acceptor domain-containing protein n=1 Tax=Janthinobacterium sp. ROICE36 TaxID=2048670 RepID=UPI000C7F2E26|nr:histidine kinase dimerization/phospho-acceptor domain-containing protein [Janthinobacterium sp. ROICE36]PLY45789.1 hypothetical protein CSZ94_04125 [Janthinobacterium sp. ROICE36]
MIRQARAIHCSVRGADQWLTPILTNTLPAFFDNLAEALTPGHPRENAASNSNVPAVHGNERARMTNYGPEQVIQEYQILRDCFAAVAQESGITLRGKDRQVLNASIDMGIPESIREFTSMHQGFRRRIAAGLSHDMRNPLAVISTSAQLLLRPADPERVVLLAHKIAEHSKRLDSMIEELRDSLSYHRGQPGQPATARQMPAQRAIHHRLVVRELAAPRAGKPAEQCPQVRQRRPRQCARGSGP